MFITLKQRKTFLLAVTSVHYVNHDQRLQSQPQLFPFTTGHITIYRSQHRINFHITSIRLKSKVNMFNVFIFFINIEINTKC
jgi:hypothetical protein